MKIAVLCGGLSSERDVSISSGTGVAKALAARGHQVVLLDSFLGYTKPFDDPSEVFQRGEVTLGGAAIGQDSPDLRAVRSMRGDSDQAIGSNVLDLCRTADMVFLAMHGGDGENGRLQAVLDMHGVRYTGSGYLGSALAMHKGVSKALFLQAGIPTPAGRVVTRSDAAYAPEFPCVVKPCSGGSSVATLICHDAAEYTAALEAAWAVEEEVLVESFVRGRELTVGVMDGKAMPVIEIIPKSGFYDYKNKYQAGATVELCPAPIGDAATVRAQRLAEQVTRALHIDVYCRVDLLWDTERDEMAVLEANTLPGMTPTSLIPQMAAAQGMDYGQLCEKIIEVSEKKYENPDR